MSDRTVSFGCGTKVLVEALIVRRAYSGLLEGAPTPEVNRNMITGRMRDLRRSLPSTKPHLVEPIPLVPDRQWERLPIYCCGAELMSHQPARDPNRMMSMGVVVWFQEDLPTQADLAAVAGRLRWADVAEDGDW